MQEEKKGSTREPVSDIQQCKDKDFSQYIINITDEYQEANPLLLQGLAPIVTEGNIATITGKPKAFKTFLISAMISAFLADEFLGISGKNGKALLIDTEQGKSHVHKVQKRIYRLCRWPQDKENDNLKVLSLRELEAGKRLEIAISAITELRPDLVVIDGVRDLVKDFNDIAESSQVVGTLMRLSTECQCGIITILHQNKADNNARGHLGTELCNKSETVLQVVNENGIATVSPVYSRNIPIEPFSFRVNEEGLPEGCNIPKVEEKTDELRQLMKISFADQSLWQRKNLIEKVALVLGRTSRTAERKVADALKLGLLAVRQDGMYYRKVDDDLPY